MLHSDLPGTRCQRNHGTGLGDRRNAWVAEGIGSGPCEIEFPTLAVGSRHLQLQSSEVAGQGHLLRTHNQRNRLLGRLNR